LDNVSGSVKLTEKNIRKPIIARITKIVLHVNQFKTTPPNNGAKIGAAPFTNASNAINFVNSFPLYISLEAARAITIPEAAEAPCINRKIINSHILGLK